MLSKARALIRPLGLQAPRSWRHVIDCSARLVPDKFRQVRTVPRYVVSCCAEVSPLLFSSRGVHTGSQPTAETSCKTIMSRMMLPVDANYAGNVHGGTILRMIDEAGTVAAMQHVNSGASADRHPSFVALARIEKTDFLAPMFVGELAVLDARVTFCSAHSCEVMVDVIAENLATGERRETNRARLWYVATDAKLKEQSASCSASNTFRTASMPPLHLEPADAVQAQQRYQAQQTQRKADAITGADKSAGCLTESGTMVSQLMLPPDVNVAGFVQAGVLLKLMDNCAGICAARHARTNIVTATLDALDVRAPLCNGNLVHIRGRPTFSSSRSLEIEVHVEAEQMESGETYTAMHGFLTFVSLDENGRALPLPPLPPPATADEEKLRESGHQRYLRRKQLRSLGQ